MLGGVLQEEIPHQAVDQPRHAILHSRIAAPVSPRLGIAA